MDDDIPPVTIAVHADTAGLAHDIAHLRTLLEQELGSGADRASRTIEAGLLRAVKTGKLGFDDLKTVALSALAEIAAAAMKNGIDAIVGTGGSAGIGSGAGTLAAALGGLLGLPGRATGGPVSPGRAYLVGERGPELFVPTASGQVAAAAAAPRDVRVSIAVTAAGGDAPHALARSSRQVARAVKAALDQAG